MPFSSLTANPRLRTLLWCRNWAKKDWVIAAIGFTIIFFAFALFSNSRHRVNESKLNHPFGLNPSNEFVKITLLRKAKEKGALCLDGSLPGYHFQKGFGSGSENWLLHIEGGGWCDSIPSCTFRRGTRRGSTNFMEKGIPFQGILSSDPLQNPDFFNWNKVKIRYCDGASLSGHPESEIKKGSGLFFRGQLIWEALMDELLSIGMSRAKQALLSGCSAGGLATLIHCDDFRELLPKDADVKCLSDASFFLDVKDIIGNSTMRSFYHNVVQLHGSAKSLHKDCVSKMEPYKCFFPEEIIKNIKTPVFLVNPAYDFWQIQHVLVPDGSDSHGYWKNCRLNINTCNADQLDVLHGFRSSLLKAVNESQQRKEVGMFIISCFIHCQTVFSETWHSPYSPKINNKTIAESVGDWYFNREEVKRIDCSFPCNPTCYNMDFTGI